MMTPCDQDYQKSVSLQNTESAKFVNANWDPSMVQSLAGIYKPSDRRWKIESETLPRQANEYVFVGNGPIVDFNFSNSNLVIKTNSIGPISSQAETNLSLVSISDSAVANSWRDAERLFSGLLEESASQSRALAAFKITLWENFPYDVLVADQNGRVPATEASAKLTGLRYDLQTWLEASIDELSLMLELSPTTLVNLVKPGRVVRLKTIRKMTVVHGLLRELQRALGSAAALTWTRTVGRRLLADGKLWEFEQFISTHIFADETTRQTDVKKYWGNDFDLDLKRLTPAGRPSRI